MLFARKLLAPGPQPKHPGNVNPVLDTGPPAEPGVYLNENYMKICFVISDIHPDQGGWGRYAWDLIRCAKCAGHVVELVTISGSRICPNDLLRVTIKSLACDIVYAVDGWPFGAIAWLATRLARRPLIIGAIGTYTIAPFFSYRTRWLARRAYGEAQAIVAISTYTQRSLLKHVATQQSSVITPGIDLHKWSCAPRNVPSDTIISVGALKARKGYHVALEAFERAKKSMPRLRWIIVGDLSNRPYVGMIMRKAALLGVADHIKLVGRVSDEQLKKYYSQAGIFMMLSENQGSHFEGFGIAFLEAAATGLPVLGTRNNGIEDAVGPDNGLLVCQGDANAAADAICTIFSDAIRWRTMSEASIAWASTHDINAMCEKLDAVYNNVTT